MFCWLGSLVFFVSIFLRTWNPRGFLFSLAGKSLSVSSRPRVPKAVISLPHKYTNAQKTVFLLCEVFLPSQPSFVYLFCQKGLTKCTANEFVQSLFSDSIYIFLCMYFYVFPYTRGARWLLFFLQNFSPLAPTNSFYEFVACLPRSAYC